MTVPSSTQNTLLLSSKYNAPVQQPYGQPQHLSEPSSDSSAMERPCRLLGPAYPGVDLYGSSYHGQPRSQRAIASRAAPTNTSDSSGSSSQLYSPLLRPIHRAAAVLGTTHAQNNRTLPPLSFDITSPSGNTIVSGGLQRRPPFITLPPPESCRSRQRSSVSPQGPHFATQVPDSSGHPRAILSPPFALQPEPRWDSSSFSTNLRPTIFATARRNTVSSVFRMHDESIDSIQNRGVVEGHSESTVLLSTSEAESTTPLIREGRYDPVRETFIPYASNILSPTSSPHTQKDPDDDIDVNDASLSPSRENFWPATSFLSDSIKYTTLTPFWWSNNTRCRHFPASDQKRVFRSLYLCPSLLFLW